MSDVRHARLFNRRFSVTLVAAALTLSCLAAVLLPGLGARVYAQEPARSQEPTRSTVVLVIRGLRNNRGLVMGGLFADEQRWLHNGEEVATCRVRIRRRAARCIVSNLPPGQYAFAFSHDENSNGDVDRNVFGIPTEGFGFSNDARPTLSAPSFESAAFRVRDRAVQVMAVRYGI